MMRGTVAVVVILLVLLGSGGLLVAAAPSPAAPITGSVAVSPAAVTHGDLVVANGTSVTIGPLSGSTTYFQGGNITVEPSGTLIVQNTTLSFVQFIGGSGTLSERLSHIYRFLDLGTVDFVNSTLTTDVATLNASAKLFVSVSGTLNVRNSVFAFPGWLNIVGSTASATFNRSAVEPNPAVAALTEPAVLRADSSSSPVLNVSGGAQFNFFGSQYTGLYQDNLTANGVPSAPPFSATSSVALPTGGLTLANGAFKVPASTNSTALAEAMLYPSEAASVTVTIDYTTTAGSTVTAPVSVAYAGALYSVGTASMPTSGSSATLVAGAGSALVQAMSQVGSPFYLSAGITFASASASGVTLTNVSLALTAAPNYNLTASGSGTRVALVDSSLGVNFNPSLSNVSSASPWASNKLLITASAEAFLANLTVPNPLPEVYATSAVLPSSGGSAVVYRWAQFNLTGGPKAILGINGGAVSAYYASDANQTNNATANALNDIAATSPAIWGYLQYWDEVQGRPAYGATGPSGIASVLLASAELDDTSLPNGNYLGDYHVGVYAPLTPPVTSWVLGAVSPYPQGVAAGSSGYGQPDVLSTINFPQYVVNASAGGVVVSANSTVSSTVRIGQVLGVNVTFTNHGEAPVYAVSATLYWNASQTTTLAHVSASGLTLANGASRTFLFTWVVNDTVTGLRGTAFLQNLSGVVGWNGTLSGSYQGAAPFTASVTIAPSQVVVAEATAPASKVSLGQTYLTSGVVRYNGSQPAVLRLFATPTSGGSPVLVGYASSLPGSFSVAWSTSGLSAGTSYTLTVVATYNGVSSAAYAAGTFSVPATPTTAKSFLTQSFFGLPLWMWLAIGAAIVVAIVAFLLFARRQAAGKLVECGECGNLIPEEATVCPKCGAEFEADLIRCSRCASTIPADSTVCPECVAQLLGKPGEGADDPERQGYADFTEKFRAEAKRELGENYTEGAFWDWWKRQPTYTSFSQWRLQQGQGTSRSGMTAPPAFVETPGPSAPTSPPPRSGTGGTPPAAPSRPTARPVETVLPPPPAGGAGLKACPNCGKEVPTDYLVCPFCGAVTQ